MSQTKTVDTSNITSHVRVTATGLGRDGHSVIRRTKTNPTHTPRTDAPEGPGLDDPYHDGPVRRSHKGTKITSVGIVRTKTYWKQELL